MKQIFGLTDPFQTSGREG